MSARPVRSAPPTPAEDIFDGIDPAEVEAFARAVARLLLSGARNLGMIPPDAVPQIPRRAAADRRPR